MTQPAYKPHLCYCQIPPEELKKIARLRYVNRVPTEDLMARFSDPKEKEYLAAIALLDVKVQDLPKIVPNNPELLLHLRDCRDHVIDILTEAGIKVS